MKYEIVIKYEYKKEFPFSSILDYVDYTGMNTKNYLDEAFEKFISDKVLEVKNKITLENYEFRVQKTLPKYLKSGMTKILFRVEFELKFECNLRKKYDAPEFTKLKEVPKELEKYIDNFEGLSVKGIFLKNI